LLWKFFTICKEPRYAERLLKGGPNAAGRRLFPPQLAKHDIHLGHRVDQGEFLKNGTYMVVVQRNGKPHGDTLAATRVNPKKDSGKGVVKRLMADAKKRGYLSGKWV
jgi:hypothetical protein